MTSTAIPREQIPPLADLLKSVGRHTVRASVMAEAAELAGRVQRLADRGATPEKLEILRACLEFSEGIKDNGPEISVSLPVWALPHVVRYFRFLAQERKSGPGLTRILLDGR